jgi:hypothetical protein
MLPETLENELSRDPFVPLRRDLDDGRTCIGDNPRHCFIKRGAMYIAPIDRPDSHWADDLDVLSLRDILSLEPIETTRLSEQ